MDPVEGEANQEGERQEEEENKSEDGTPRVQEDDHSLDPSK